MMVTPAVFSCAWCGEINNTFVDPSQGIPQEYVEDCQVCCRPNNLYVNGQYPDYQITAEPE